MKIYNGTIISCDRENHVHNYLVEDKGRILYAGADLPDAYKGAPLERLGERALLPCFGDSHLHFASYALFNAGLDVRSARSLPELSGQVLNFARGSSDALLMGDRKSTRLNSSH